MLQVAMDPCLETCTPAAMSATVKVFQLISTVSEPAVKAQIQMLDEFGTEAKRCPQERLPGMLQCMAEAAALQRNSHVKVGFLPDWLSCRPSVLICGKALVVIMQEKRCPQERLTGMLQCIAEAASLQHNSHVKVEYLPHHIG